MDWDAGFSKRSQMFAPYAGFAARLNEFGDWPPRAELDVLLAGAGVRNRGGELLRAVAPESAGARSYEARILSRAELEVRERDWHDFFNVLSWCTFPRAKAALNAAHVAAAAAEVGGNRGRRRDALTLFDESGAIVLSSAPDLLEDLRDFRWKRLFWTERERFCASVKVYVFGHALLEKALTPYIGMTAHALTLVVSQAQLEQAPERLLAQVDDMAASRIRESFDSPRDLAPLPVLGVPGWWMENEAERFYDNPSYFRPRSPKAM